MDEPRRLERELDRIFASLGHGMYIVDSDRKVRLWNRAAEAMLGWSEDDILGRDCRELIGHLDDDGNRLCDGHCPLEASMGDANTIFAGTVRAHTRDGDTLPVNVSCAPLLDDDGRVVGAVEVFADMTKEKEVEQLKSTMCSVVAHELRTPLTSMKGYLELVLAGDAGEVTEEQRQFLKIIETNTERLNELIDDFLDIERLESGRADMHWEQVDVRSLAEQVMDTLAMMAEGKGLVLERELEEIPPVAADRIKLERVVSNLVSNAIKYTNEGRVTVRTRSDGGEVVISVEDTGVGIPAEELQRIGEKFFRASTATLTRATGSGLGLAITREIVGKHSGRIEIESTTGEGSVFKVMLPVTEERKLL